MLDIQRGLLYFVDKHGKWSSEDAQSSDEGSDSHNSTPFENTPSLQSVLSVERSTSGSSLVYPSAESSDGTEVEVVTPTLAGLNTTGDSGTTRVELTKPKSVPRKNGAVGPLEFSVPVAIRPLISRQPGGGPPPPDGRFFSNPLNLRTIITGTGDGYRSPEPPSRRNGFSPPRRHPTLGGSLPVSELNLPEMVVPSFSVPQPVVTQASNDPGLGMEHGYGPSPPSSSSLVLPVELMVYTDLMVDIGTAQYLGGEMREPGPSPFAHPPMLAHVGRGVNGSGSRTDGYRWEDLSHCATNGPPQVVPSVWYPQQDQPYRGVDHAPAQQVYAGNEGQWPTSGIVDYK